MGVVGAKMVGAGVVGVCVVGAKVVGADVGSEEGGTVVGTNVPEVTILHWSETPWTFRKASTPTYRTFPSGSRLSALHVSSLPVAIGTHWE